VSRPARLLLCGASGALVCLAAPNHDLWLLAWFGFVPLLYATRDASPRSAFLYGCLAGLVCHLGTYSWMTALLVRFGRLPWAAALPIYVLLALYVSLPWGVLGWGVRRCRPAVVLTAPLFFVGAEFLLPRVLNGYLAITQAWVPPVIQVAELTGPHGVSFLIVTVNGAIFSALTARAWRPAALAAAVMLAVLSFGFVRISQVEATRATAPKTRVGIVQGNRGVVRNQHRSVHDRNHVMHLDVSRRLELAGAELLLWPESTYPYGMNRQRTLDFAAADRRRMMRDLHVPVLFGVVTRDSETRRAYNSAALMTPESRLTHRYDKVNLLLFGEYIPFSDRLPVMRKLIPAASSFTPGEGPGVFDFHGHKLAPLICYEDMIPAYTREVAGLKPNLLINLTNDAWFGLTQAPRQHLALAVFRAVELRLDLVRAVNTGPSAFVSATGRVRAETPLFDPVSQPDVEPVTLLEEASLMPPPSTVYATIGNLFAWLAVLAAAGLLVFRPQTSSDGTNSSKVA
jgi:apolipoprotein N-acyltransferase